MSRQQRAAPEKNWGDGPSRGMKKAGVAPETAAPMAPPQSSLCADSRQRHVLPSAGKWYVCERCEALVTHTGTSCLDVTKEHQVSPDLASSIS